MHTHTPLPVCCVLARHPIYSNIFAAKLFDILHSMQFLLFPYSVDNSNREKEREREARRKRIKVCMNGNKEKDEGGGGGERKIEPNVLGVCVCVWVSVLKGSTRIFCKSSVQL